jgi:hypothetical protein
LKVLASATTKNAVATIDIGNISLNPFRGIVHWIAEPTCRDGNICRGDAVAVCGSRRRAIFTPAASPWYHRRGPTPEAATEEALGVYAVVTPGLIWLSYSSKIRAGTFSIADQIVQGVKGRIDRKVRASIWHGQMT